MFEKSGALKAAEARIKAAQEKLAQELAKLNEREAKIQEEVTRRKALPLDEYKAEISKREHSIAKDFELLEILIASEEKNTKLQAVKQTAGVVAGQIVSSASELTSQLYEKILGTSPSTATRASSFSSASQSSDEQKSAYVFAFRDFRKVDIEFLLGDIKEAKEYKHGTLPQPVVERLIELRAEDRQRDTMTSAQRMMEPGRKMDILTEIAGFIAQATEYQRNITDLNITKTLLTNNGFSEKNKEALNKEARATFTSGQQTPPSSLQDASASTSQKKEKGID